MPTAFPSVTPTEEESQTIASLSTLLGYEKYIYNAGDKYGYRKYQDAPFFPDGYTSKLYRVGEYLGISVPDIYDRHRQMNTISSEFQRSSRYGVCPPHDLPPHGESLPSPSKPSGFYPPTLDALSTSTVGLVLVTYNAVDTLRNTLQSWEEAGILGLFDDRVMFANDPYEEEIQLGLEHGFRIFTPRAQDLTRLMDARQSILSEILRGEQPRYGSFPHLKPGREPNNPDSVRTFVGPAQLLSYLELRTDYVVFAEKDYMLAPHQTLESIVRTLLASVSLLQRNTRVVRLRRTDHPEDPKTIPNCCNRGCGGSYNAFYKSCEWSSHLNWLALYCDKQGIETLSRGQMLHCMNERETLKDYVIGANPRGHPVLQLPRTKDATILRQWEQYEESEQDSHRMEDPIAQMTRDEVENMQVEPLEMYCVSMDHSNWSNNIAMFEREWWINVLGIGAIQTEPDNGMFEVSVFCHYSSSALHLPD